MKAKTTQGLSLRNPKPVHIKIPSIAVCIVCLCISSLKAAGHTVEATRIQKITDTPLEHFEGFYQFPNKVAYIQFVQRDNRLIAKQVWGNREYELVRQNDLNFESKDEAYKIAFIKDNRGKITEARILGHNLLTRVDYDPTKDAILTSTQLERLVGKYQFQRDKNRMLTISVKNKGVELKQLWDGQVIFFSPKSEQFFLNEELSFPLTFIMKNKEIIQLVCFANDIWDKIE